MLNITGLRKMQIKTMRYHLVPIRMGIIRKKQKIRGVGKDVGKSEPSCTDIKNVKWYNHYGKQHNSSTNS